MYIAQFIMFNAPRATRIIYVVYDVVNGLSFRL